MTEDLPQSSTEPVSTSQWYYQLLGLATGPVTRERMEWLIKNQHVVAASQIGPTKAGPWQRLDKSEFKSLIVEKPPEEKKKGVRISSRSFKAPRREKKPENTDHTEIVIDGIEIDDEIKLVTKPTAANRPLAPPTKPPQSSPQPSDASDAARAWDEIEGQNAEPSSATTPSPVVAPIDDARPIRETKPKEAKKEGVSPERRKLAIAGIAVAVLAGLFLIIRSWTSGPDGTQAYEVFRRVGTAIEVNSESMDDNQWALFVRDSRLEVKDVLEPLRDQVSSDYPRAQALMWAGDKLTIMLKGARQMPRGIKRQFDAYMAEYAGDPIAEVEEEPATEGDGEKAEQKTIVDPMFQ